MGSDLAESMCIVISECATSAVCVCGIDGDRRERVCVLLLATPNRPLLYLDTLESATCWTSGKRTFRATVYSKTGVLRRLPPTPYILLMATPRNTLTSPPKVPHVAVKAVVPHVVPTWGRLLCALRLVTGAGALKFLFCGVTRIVGKGAFRLQCF